MASTGPGAGAAFLARVVGPVLFPGAIGKCEGSCQQTEVEVEQWFGESLEPECTCQCFALPVPH